MTPALPKLRWSFSTLGCPDASLDEAMALARDFGMRDLEIRALNDELDLPALFAREFGEPGRLKAWLEEKGIRICSLDTSLKMAEASEEDRAAFVPFAEWAEALDVPYLRVFDGGQFAPELSAENREALVATTAWWADLRAQRGWQTQVMIETHNCLCSAAAISAYYEVTPTPIPLLWDSHHTWRLGGEDPLDTWARFQDRVVHIHVKDSISKPSGRHDHTYVHLGDGEFALQPLLQRLGADDYQGIVSLEWERKWHPYLDPLPEALKRGREAGLIVT